MQTEQDLLAMGYTSIDSLKGVKADELYQKECDLRGCSIDRCQLYLYRALEYYNNSENPDMDKCKWWYWKDDYFYPSPCGARCVICPSFPKELSEATAHMATKIIYRNTTLSPKRFAIILCIPLKSL